MTIVALRTAQLPEQTIERLRGMLIEGQIAPGAKLNERELCERLGVSRTPLREAIRRLAAQGLVQLLPNRGAVATKLTADEVRQVFEVIAQLESMSGRLACLRATSDQLTEIKALHYEMLAAHARRDLSAYYELNARIHYAIATAADNPVLLQTYQQLNARIAALRFKSNFDQHKWDIAVEQHHQMLQALEQRDAQRLSDLLLDHLHHKLGSVLEQMKKLETHSGVEHVVNTAPISTSTPTKAKPKSRKTTAA